MQCFTRYREYIARSNHSGFKKMRTAIEKSGLEMTKVKITVPKGCGRDALSVNALDSITRELAYGTLITVDGKILPCTAFKVKNGSLTLEVQAGYFEINEEV